MRLLIMCPGRHIIPDRCRGHRAEANTQAEDSIIPHKHPPGATVCTSTALPCPLGGSPGSPYRGSAQGQGELTPDPAQPIPSANWQDPAEGDLSASANRRPGSARQDRAGQSAQDANERPRDRFGLHSDPHHPARVGRGIGVHFWGCLCACGRLPVGKVGRASRPAACSPGRACPQGVAVHRVRCGFWGGGGGAGEGDFPPILLDGGLPFLGARGGCLVVREGCYWPWRISNLGTR